MKKYTMHQVPNPPLHKSHGMMNGYPEYITIHNTANDAPAKNEASYAANSSNPVSFHFAVDESEAWQIMPLDYSAWHASDHKGPGNTKSIAIEIARSLDYKTDRYARAEANAAHLAAQLLSQFNLGLDRLRRHYDWDPAKSPKRCPHRMFERANGWNQFREKVKLHLETLEENKKAPGAPSGPADPGAYTHLQRIQVGAFKSEKNAQTRIEDIKRISGVSDLNYEKGRDGLFRVYAGAFSNPENLKKRLLDIKKSGFETIVSSEGKVQHKGEAVKEKTTEELAQEVLQGKHGNGSTRKRSLGQRYAEVQELINEILQKKNNPLKTEAQIAKEVWEGKWGNGADRIRRLKASGYDPTRIQREVNKRSS